MNKKFIEFVEKHTYWKWATELKYFVLKFENKIFTENLDIVKAKPEDLLGWQIRFAEEHGYRIEVRSLHYGTLNYMVDLIEINNKKNRVEQISEMDEFFKTYQEAFDVAWKKFLELIGVTNEWI